MPSTTALAGAFLLSGLAIANPLTTLDVCPNATPSVSACTVTSQHQSVSTCIPTSSTCSDKVDGSKTVNSCSTAYSYSSWAYVSTVIPCAWDGKTISSCTVTKTDQVVPCSASATTITSVFPVHTSFPEKNSTDTPSVSYSTTYQTISKHWDAPYNKLGPFAIPGYDGCELCTDCAAKSDGTQSQHYDVTECSNSGDEKASCSSFPENRVSSKAHPGSSTPVSAVNSIKTSVPSAGAYTFTFTNTAPAATITSNGQKVTVPPRPWFNYQTRSFGGPRDVDFTVTVTKSIFVYAPFQSSTGSAKPVDPTNIMHWGDWKDPVETKTSAAETKTPEAGRPPFGRPGSGSNSWGPWGSKNPSASSSASLSYSTSGSASYTTSGSFSFTNSYTGSYTTSGSVSYTTSGTFSRPSSFTDSFTTSGTFSRSNSFTGSFTTSGSSFYTTSGSVSYTTSSTTSYTTSGVVSYTTSATTSHSTSGNVPAGSQPTDVTFYIPIRSSSSSKYRRAVGDQYIAFDGNGDGKVVNSVAEAATFHFDVNGYLLSGAQYVLTSASAGSIEFELSSNPPTSGTKFQLVNGAIVLPGAGFCTIAGPPATIWITYSSTPSGCSPVTLVEENTNAVVTTTSSTTTSTVFSTTFSTLVTSTTKPAEVSSTTGEAHTTGASATTTGESPEATEDPEEDQDPTTPADPSADLDAPDPTPTPVSRPRKRGGVIRRSW